MLKEEQSGTENYQGDWLTEGKNKKMRDDEVVMGEVKKEIKKIGQQMEK